VLISAAVISTTPQQQQQKGTGSSKQGVEAAKKLS
jgi:hypothetical protein